MNILVTGGAGFIGSHLVDLLIESGHNVSIVDNLTTGKEENINQKARFYNVDIRSDELTQVFKEVKPEGVFHLAAQSSVPPSLKDPQFDEAVNVMGTLNILNCMRKFDSHKIIYSSSAAIYGNPVSLPIDENHPIQPLSPYGLSKYVAEEYIKLYERMYGIDYSILRYANIYGPRQIAEGEGGVIAIFTDKIRKKEPITIFGDGSQTRDFVFVKDVATANLMAMEKGSKLTANIGTGQAISVLDLVDLLEGISGYQIEVNHVPEREGDILHSRLEPNASYNSIGWKAKTLISAGIEQTLMFK